MRTFITADQHFGHQNVIRFADRPYVDAWQMDEDLIKRHNRVVGPRDLVYMLGDICYRASLDKANELISRLHGRKILIRGNHDKSYDPALFEDMLDLTEIKYDDKRIVLCHYPLLEWKGSQRGSYHFHGHQHNHTSYNLEMRAQGIHRYDVGVDANHYTPVDMDMLMLFMEGLVDEVM